MGPRAQSPAEYGSFPERFPIRIPRGCGREPGRMGQGNTVPQR